MENESGTLKKNETRDCESLIRSVLTREAAETLGSEHIINILLSILLSHGHKAEAEEALRGAVEYLNAKDGFVPEISSL